MSLPLRSVLAAALVTGSASLAGAQAVAARPVSLGISAGANIPQGDFADIYGAGYLVAGHMKLRPAASPLGLRFDLGYSSNGIKSEFEDVVDSDLSIISGFANVVYEFPVTSTTIRPYVLGGLGLGSLKISATGDFGGGSVSESERQTKFGFQVGGGVEIPLSGITGFAEVGWQRYSVEGGSLAQIPIRFGVRF
jgi:opacity protein-like surface antigen